MNDCNICSMLAVFLLGYQHMYHRLSESNISTVRYINMSFYTVRATGVLTLSTESGGTVKAD